MFVLPLSHHTVRRATAAPAFDRSLDESLARIFSRAAEASSAGPSAKTPAMDVTENDTAYTVVLDVPGVSKAQLKVSVEGRRVSIETTDAAPAEGQEAQRVLYRERTAARYARTVSLPSEVDQAASQATFENGVLTLSLTKKVPTGATQLSIN
jgi:HSP20 family protein